MARGGRVSRWCWTRCWCGRIHARRGGPSCRIRRSVRAAPESPPPAPGARTGSPAPRYDPSAASHAICSSVSVPSTTTVSPSERARLTIAGHHHADAAVVRNRLDERAVHLQRIDRKAVQIRQRRIAGAEVVERDAHAETLQREDFLRHQFGIFHHHRLGDFEFEAARGDAGFLDRVRDRFEQIAAPELHGRNVHRERQRRRNPAAANAPVAGTPCESRNRRSARSGPSILRPE